jgi:hypothetical protein
MSAAAEKPVNPVEPNVGPGKKPWRFRLCLGFGLISVATVIFGSLVLADFIAAKNAQEKLLQS